MVAKKEVEEVEGGDVIPMFMNLNPYERAELELITTKPDRYVITRENYIFVVGSHPDILDLKKPGIDAFLPDEPDREFVREEYIHSISPVKILRGIMVQKAEEAGIISALSRKMYVADLNHKVALLHIVASSLNLIDMEKVGSYANYMIPLEGGGVRKGFQG